MQTEPRTVRVHPKWRDSVEYLGDVVARQPVLTDPLKALLAEHGPDASVKTETRHTPFGTFLLSVEVVK